MTVFLCRATSVHIFLYFCCLLIHYVHVDSNAYMQKWIIPKPTLGSAGGVVLVSSIRPQCWFCNIYCMRLWIFNKLLSMMYLGTKINWCIFGSKGKDHGLFAKGLKLCCHCCQLTPGSSIEFKMSTLTCHVDHSCEWISVVFDWNVDSLLLCCQCYADTACTAARHN